MDLEDNECLLDLQALRRQVGEGNFALRPHVMQHAVKEGFRADDVVQVILNGKVIEEYPGRRRCLFGGEATVEEIRVALHVVCEHAEPEAVVDIVTSYIPSEREWATPSRRRRKK